MGQNTYAAATAGTGKREGAVDDDSDSADLEQSGEREEGIEILFFFLALVCSL